MKLSKRTIDILKNYFLINQSIVVSPGNHLATVAIARNLMGECTVEETFPTEFAIYNLNEFLSAVSLFENPDLDFQEKFVLIREEGATRGGLKYFYANKALIVYPTKSIKMPDEIDVKFTLTESNFIKLTRAAGVLGVNDVAIVGDEEGISLIVQDKKNDSSNDFEIQVSDKAVEKPFKFYLKQENLKFMPTDYAVMVSAKGIASFTSADGMMKYAVALEA
jgi:hypothetical protein